MKRRATNEIKLQRIAPKLVFRLKKLPYETRLEMLDLYPLEQRRLRGDLIETFKIMTGAEDVPTNYLRGYDMTIYKQKSHLASRAKFFLQRVVNYWDSLPSHVMVNKTHSKTGFTNTGRK